MSGAFSALKKNRKKNFEKLREQLSKNTTERNDDERFWNLSKDKAGVGSAIIRFIPNKENTYWTQEKQHAFKVNNKWFIQNCPTVIGKDCPVCTMNTELWNTDTKENQSIVRNRSRKTRYIMNIFVVKDPSNPDNDGTVKLFRCGPKIFDKVKALMQPEYEDESPVDPFDYWEGKDFKLRSKTKDKYINYDDSQFIETNCFSDFSDEDIEKIYEQTYDLAEFTSEDKFKSYDELKKQLDRVLDVKGHTSSESDSTEETDEEEDTKPISETKVGKTRKSKSEEKQQTKSSKIEESDDEADDLLKEIESLISDD